MSEEKIADMRDGCRYWWVLIGAAVLAMVGSGEK